MGDNTTSPLVVLVGPTAVGKTDLAVKLAAELNGEIVSADSMQVYRGLDIGTAKPPLEVRLLVPHHLIDVACIDEPYSAARYVQEADEVIADIRRRGRTVFVVGGTGLYIRALLRGLFPGPAADDELRDFYRRLGEEKGVEHLFDLLVRVDPKGAARIHPHDKVRIIRALEVTALTGRSIVEQQGAHGFQERRYDYLKLGLTMDRAELYERIDRRCREMVDKGLLEETKRLLAMGYDERLRPLRALGYRHMVSHLQGGLTLEGAVEIMARDTRRYAKRQETWFRAEMDIQWFHPREINRIRGKILDFRRDKF